LPFWIHHNGLSEERKKLFFIRHQDNTSKFILTQKLEEGGTRFALQDEFTINDLSKTTANYGGVSSLNTVINWQRLFTVFATITENRF
jgi:hypothetical protein